MFGPYGADDRSEFPDHEFPSRLGTSPGLNQPSIKTKTSVKTAGRYNSSEPKHRFSLRLVALLNVLVWLNERAEARLRAWRWGTSVQTFSVLTVLALQSSFVGDVAASEPIARFDVPSLTIAEVVNKESNDSASGLISIKVSIPVTSELTANYRDDIDEFRYDIRWQQARYPVINYFPRTRTTSTIDGTIGVETQKDRSATIGLALNGGRYFDLGGSAKAEALKRDAKKVRYQEVPQQDVLVASGSVDRGTGVFFRFHRSRQETLEGSRELSAIFRVPEDWQAGLLKVECRASGQRKVAGLWNDPFEVVQSFTLPAYLSGHAEAQKRAVEFVRAEYALLNRDAVGDEIKTNRPIPSSVEQAFRGLFEIGNDSHDTNSEPQSRVVRNRVPYPINISTKRKRVYPSGASNTYRQAREALLKFSL